jgi:hypothetical protein
LEWLKNAINSKTLNKGVKATECVSRVKIHLIKL